MEHVSLKLPFPSKHLHPLTNPTLYKSCRFLLGNVFVSKTTISQGILHKPTRFFIGIPAPTKNPQTPKKRHLQEKVVKVAEIKGGSLLDLPASQVRDFTSFCRGNWWFCGFLVAQKIFTRILHSEIFPGFFLSWKCVTSKKLP